MGASSLLANYFVAIAVEIAVTEIPVKTAQGPALAHINSSFYARFLPAPGPLEVDHAVAAAGANCCYPLISITFAKFFQVLFFLLLLGAAAVADRMPAFGALGPAFICCPGMSAGTACYFFHVAVTILSKFRPERGRPV